MDKEVKGEYVKRTQKDYSMSFKLQIVQEIEQSRVEGRKMLLSGEILSTTSWLWQEVSRYHSSYGKRATNRTCGGLTK